MKRITLLAMSMVLSTALNADIKSYIGAGLGFMATPDTSGAENGMGMTLQGGVRGFITDMPETGARFELNKSLMGLNNGDALTFATYITYDINIPNSQLAIRPKFGLIIPNASDDVNSRDMTFSSGISGIFSLNEQIDLYVDYTVLGEFITNYSIGAEFKF